MKTYPVFDGHNDTLLELTFLKSDPISAFIEGNDHHDLDMIKMRNGHFIGGLFALFTPPHPDSIEAAENYGLTIRDDGYVMTMHSALDQQYAEQKTRELIKLARNIEKATDRSLRIVYSASDIRQAMDCSAISALLHIEGAACIKEDLSNLESFYDLGVRSVGPVWSRPNAFGTGVRFEAPHSPDTGPGLTEAGKNLIRTCNELGILVDLAHINLQGFWDAASISNKPLVVSHSGVYSICPSTRNVTDEQIDAVANSSGLIGIILEPINTRPDYKPNEDTPLSVLVDHIEYIKNRVGIDHVAIGSDFDGAQMYKDLQSAAELQNLCNAMQEHGFSDAEIEKVAYKNWLRVIEETIG